ncbi:hypothetical protein ABGB12_22545 [Actinocorallia sp. B10E7]|uniref:hypothetical protein n=1 Tax=Actinocorallia sp. B10E7 TaxID=3153558 RepID=UPI00325E597B
MDVAVVLGLLSPFGGFFLGFIAWHLTGKGGERLPERLRLPQRPREILAVIVGIAVFAATPPGVVALCAAVRTPDTPLAGGGCPDGGYFADVTFIAEDGVIQNSCLLTYGSVEFRNQSTTQTVGLCIGRDGVCDTSPMVPGGLRGEFAIEPGASRTVTLPLGSVLYYPSFRSYRFTFTTPRSPAYGDLKIWRTYPVDDGA